MGQVITLMPLLNETVFIQEPNVDMFNNAIKKAASSSIPKETSNLPTISVSPSKTPTTSKPITRSGSVLSGKTPTSSVKIVRSTITGSGSGSGSASGNANTEYNVNWSSLNCDQVYSELQRLTNIKAQTDAAVSSGARPNPYSYQNLITNINTGTSLYLQNCQTTSVGSGSGTGGGGFDMGGGGGGFDMGGGDFQQPSTEQYEVLGYDATGCPIYGYDENGTPLYGVDQFGNIITDPTLLPCGMVAGGDATNMETMPSVGGEIPKGEEMPFLGIKDKTTRTAIIVVGAIAIAALILK